MIGCGHSSSVLARNVPQQSSTRSPWVATGSLLTGAATAPMILASRAPSWCDTCSTDGSTHSISPCGGVAMTFEEILNQTIALLQRQGRVSYRALKRQFDLDE